MWNVCITWPNLCDSYGNLRTFAKIEPKSTVVLLPLEDITGRSLWRSAARVAATLPVRRAPDRRGTARGYSSGGPWGLPRPRRTGPWPAQRSCPGTEDRRRWTPPSVRDPKKLAYAVGSKAIEPTIDPSFFSKVSKSMFWNSVIAGSSTELLKDHEIILKLCTHKNECSRICISKHSFKSLNRAEVRRSLGNIAEFCNANRRFAPRKIELV